ncbi:MAG TPA: hypothetical protein VEN81_17510, partial [Planctomycetota bacterium]|nr:hypothetical protein [Planctomycetota bacterium]
MKKIVAATLVAMLAGAALGQDGKTELRYKFQKGDKFPLKIGYSMGVKLDKVPEAFQGVLSDEPMNLKFEGTVAVEVKEVEEGKAVLEGTWKTMRAKGAVMVNDVDFTYDADKKTEAKPKKAEDDPGLQGFLDLEDQFRKMSQQTLRLTVDSRGQVTADGAGAKGVGEMSSMFFSINGLMGPLPKKAVGQGDTWQEEMKMEMPGLAGAVDLRVKSDNTWASTDTEEGRTCAVIKSKLAVGGEGKAEQDGDNAFKIKMKTQGEGEGKMSFCS